MNAEALRHYWHPVALSTEVTDRPFATQLLDEPLVLFRTGDRVGVCQDLCIHRGTPLSLGRVEAGRIVCGYHGWEYGASGRCVHIPALREGQPIPAKARVPAYRAEEQHGMIWVCLDEPHAPIPPFPEASDPDYEVYFGGAFVWEAAAARMIENFMDLGHLSWVHPNVLGSPSDHLVPDHKVRLLEQGLAFDYTITGPPQGAKLQGTNPIHYTQRLYLPFTIHHTRVWDDKRSANFFTCQPLSATRTRRYMWVTRKGNFDFPIEDLQDTLDLIREQDRPFVEAQRPEALPVDLSAEMHLQGADAAAVAYRRLLAALGVE